jgi:tellurite resistance protein
MPMAKELLIQSLLSAIHADGEISVEEAELLRVICASLHCPVPV